MMEITNQKEILWFVKDLKHLLSLLFQWKSSFLRLNQNKNTSIKLIETINRLNTRLS